ncbi:MAG: zinc-dependent metalloprotease [Saprospiraceae bacterium]|jgi:hypothetical protein|nr:zinc-dependent metalloprotease [Saprospiraceae bacterium]
MRKISLFVVLLLTSYASLTAQKQNFCGTTEFGALTERLKMNKELFKQNPVGERAIKWVPVKFHLISKSDGTGAVREDQVLDMLCGMNEFYAPLDIQFYIKDGFSYFSNTSAATDPQSQAGTTQIKGKKVKSVLNMFLAQSFATPGLLGYYTEGYPGYQNDFLVLKKSEVGKGIYTAEHELGHFFSLLHPFNGWEDNDYDPAVHGNPVKILTAPNTSSEPPFNPIAIEFVDQSNCQTAGDLICDTPASYNFANNYWAGKGCLPMDQSVLDYKGQVVDPDEQNVMDYFQGCTQYKFSTTQQNLINADLSNRFNTFGAQKINGTYVPNQDIITDKVTFPYPFHKSTISNFGDINLDWEDIPGATAYYVLIDVTSSFTFQPKSAIVTSSNWTATGLAKNKKYNWLVYPFNERSTCGGPSVFEFTTGAWVVSTSEIKELDNWKLQPNPAISGSEVIIQAQTIDNFVADILVYDITGRLMNVQNKVQFVSGENQINISTENLHKGMYMVQIKSESGVTSQKMIID